MNITISKPRADEIDRVKEVTEQAYKEPYRKNGLITQFKELDDLKEKFLSGEIGIIVAYVDGVIVASSRYKLNEVGEIYLFKLAVLKEFRNNGLASRLLSAIEDEARKIKCPITRLDCVQEKFLVPFYEKQGYVVDEIREHGNHHDVYMSKML